MKNTRDFDAWVRENYTRLRATGVSMKAAARLTALQAADEFVEDLAEYWVSVAEEELDGPLYESSQHEKIITWLRKRAQHRLNQWTNKP